MERTRKITGQTDGEHDIIPRAYKNEDQSRGWVDVGTEVDILGTEMQLSVYSVILRHMVTTAIV